MDAEAFKFLAVGLAGGLGMLGPGIGLGLIGLGAMQALGRNPEANGAFTRLSLQFSWPSSCSIDS